MENCFDCGTPITAQESHYNGMIVVCNTCRKFYKRCRGCGTQTNEATKLQGEWYCTMCAEKIIEELDNVYKQD